MATQRLEHKPQGIAPTLPISLCVKGLAWQNS